MTPEQAVMELIGEIRTERRAAEQRHIDLMDELHRARQDIIETKELVAQLSVNFEQFRTHVMEHADKEGRHLRMVAAHSGVIDPDDRNGGGE